MDLKTCEKEKLGEVNKRLMNDLLPEQNATLIKHGKHLF